LAACLVILGGAIAVAGGSAGNRVGTPSLQATSAVTYGQNIAYTATFTNDGQSVFTHLTFTMAPPVVEGTTLRATSPRASSGSCAVDANDVLTCDFGQFRPEDPAASVTVVWKVPGDTSLPGCSDCLVATGTWLIDERKATNGNETFAATERVGLVGTSSDPALSARQRAGGYQLDGCSTSDPSSTSLSTDQALNAKDNPVSTSLCLPSGFAASVSEGLQSAITEPTKDSPNYAHQSSLCVAQSGEDCDNPAATPHDFSPDKLTLTFRVAKEALPKRYQITGVSHDGGAPVAAGACDSSGFCVLSIHLDKRAKVWTIVVASPTNGHFNW
jgi:uncharacterized repeat protein (TIGR01451 family)